MNYDQDQNDMKEQDEDNIQTKVKIRHSLQRLSSELNLIDDLKKLQIKWEEDNQKLTNETFAQVDNPIETNNDELNYDNEIFADVITKLKIYIDKSKEEKLKECILFDEWEVFNEFLTLIEKYETTFTNKDLLVLTKGLKSFINVTNIVDPNIIFKTNLDDAKEIFYLYFNLINFNVVQNYLKNIQLSNDLNILYRIFTPRILTVMRYTAFYADLNLNDLQRPINCIDLLSLMINYVKIYLESLDSISNTTLNDTLVISSHILQFIIYYAEDTIMVSDLIKAECLETIVNGLAITCKSATVDYALQEYLIAIIFTIGFHDNGIKKLNALNAVSVIKIFLSNNVDADLNTLGFVTLALLSTPEQIKKDGKYMNCVLDTLLKMISNASISSDYRTGTNYQLSELLVVFVKIFNDDRTLDYIMEYSQVDLHAPSTIDFFINLLMNYHSTVDNKDSRKRTICTALVNILWSISFQDKYKQKLKNANTNFKELIKNMTKAEDEKIAPYQYVPYYLEDIQKAAEGILINIDEVIQQVIEKQINHLLPASTNNQKFMIMISYSHKNTDFCKQICTEILKKGYDIWIDFKCLKTGDLWETIAAGMKQANVIVCLISKEYCNSKSCRLEATFALDKLQATKSVIPVFLREYELPNWLEIRTAVLKYVLFRDLKQLEHEKLLELMDMVEDSLPANLPHKDPNTNPSVHSKNDTSVTKPMAKGNEVSLKEKSIHPLDDKESLEKKPTTTKIEKQDNLSKNDPVIRTTNDENVYKDKPIEEWNKNDIYQWFENNEIICEFRDLCQFKDGYELLNYAKIFLDTEKFQYHLYSDEFLKRDGITSGKRPLLLHEFTKFSNALRKLEKFRK